MGIQINGQTDTITAIDGGLNVSGADLGSASAGSLNVTGIVTASGFSGNVTGNLSGNVTGNISGNVTGNLSGNINSTGVSTVTTLSATNIVGVSTAGITTVYTSSFNGGQLGGARNIIINGSMMVNQRGWTGAAGNTTNGSYVTDRFVINGSHDGAVSVGQTTLTSTTGGNAYADGFQSALFFNVTTADASLSASQFQQINQFIEGYNVQGIKKGTANAHPVTLSFWCRSTTTGTYIAELGDYLNSRQVSQAYTINAANTWEKKTLTFPADASGVLNNNNARILDVKWWLAAGSTYSGGTLNTSWAAVTSANIAAGQTNLLASAGNNFWLTGVQLEVGSVATEFERRSFGQELALAQRYYCKNSNPDVVATAGANYLAAGMFSSGTVNAYTANAGYSPWISFPVTMRTTPSTITFIPTSLGGSSSGQWTIYNISAPSWTSSNVSVQSSTANGFGAVVGGTWGAGATLMYGAWTASAEL